MAQALAQTRAFNPRTFATLFFCGMAYAITYAAPFVQYVLYDPTLKALGATNAQLGFLVMIFGWGNIVGAPLGGILSDKFNHKTIYIGGLLGTSLLSVLLAYNLNYDFALLVFGGFAVTGLFMLFPAHIKVVRLLTDENSQGKVFGFAEAFAGLGSVIVNTIALTVFAWYTDEVLGFKYVLVFFGVCGVACAAVLYFLVDGPAKLREKGIIEEGQREKIAFADFIAVLRCPGTWFAGIAVFSTYTLYCSISYFTPYFTKVLGVSVVFSGSLAIIRTYVIRFVMSPVGGMLGDKLGSVTKVLLISWIGAAVIVATIMFLPAGAPLGIAIMLMLLMGVFTFTARGSMFAVPSEVKIPVKYAAITAGIVCAIGYSPDLFIFILFGHWIDTYGNAAYNYIFIYDIVVCAIGVVSALLTFRYKRRSAVQTDVPAGATANVTA